MIFRTLITYIVLAFEVLTGYRHVGISDKIRAEKGDVAGDEYAAERAAERIKRVFRCAGTEIIVEGRENIPKNRNFVLISNHQSNADAFAVLATLERPIAFVAKAELEKVPILNNWMRAVGCVFMDRNDIRQSMKALLEGINKVKAGDSMAIFPEGTCTSGPMLEFKHGSFKLATKSGAPILPLTIDGTHKILEDNNFRIKKTTVRLIYHPIIETAGMTREEKNMLPDMVRNIIAEPIESKGD